jgi:hypothetical protein
MIYASDACAYLFGYSRLEDRPGDWDVWYETAEAAEQSAHDEFGVRCTDWAPIDDPLPGAQHDWIRPMRVKCDAHGNKLWGQFEAISAAGDGKSVG